MSRGPVGMRLTRDLARVLLRCYPRHFRQRWASEFIEAAAHRWRREREKSCVGALGTLRAGLYLCADTLGAAPGTWRSTPGWGDAPDGSDPRQTWRARLMSAICSLVPPPYVMPKMPNGF